MTMPKQTWHRHVWVLLLLSPGVALAQDKPDAFNGLRTPSAPAFVLLGVEPVSVERPNTPSDFAASILSNTNSLSSLPKNFALEVAPFWLLPHKNRSWRDDTTRTIGQSLARTFTVALATAEVGVEGAPVQGLAISGRASVLSGRLATRSQHTLERIDSIARLASLAILTSQKPWTEHSDKLLVLTIGGPGTVPATAAAINTRLIAASEGLVSATTDSAFEVHRKAALKAAVEYRPLIARGEQEGWLSEEQVDSARVTLKRLTSTLEQVVQASDERIRLAQESWAKLQAEAETYAPVREGLMVDVAAGLSARAPSAAADSLDSDRWGIWVTASYTGSSASVLGVLRYLGQREDTGPDAVDVGARVIYTHDRYALSAEYIYRHVSGEGTENQWRAAAIVDYRLSKNLWLTGTFGRSYDDQAPGSLLAQFGLSVQLSSDRYSTPLPSMSR